MVEDVFVGKMAIRNIFYGILIDKSMFLDSIN